MQPGPHLIIEDARVISIVAPFVGCLEQLCRHPAGGYPSSTRELHITSAPECPRYHEQAVPVDLGSSNRQAPLERDRARDRARPGHNGRVLISDCPLEQILRTIYGCLIIIIPGVI